MEAIEKTLARINLIITKHTEKMEEGNKTLNFTCHVRFQVLTAASMMFRAVFWVVILTYFWTKSCRAIFILFQEKGVLFLKHGEYH
jgi:hypothetical protein